jgi:hypothetical protein
MQRRFEESSHPKEVASLGDFTVRNSPAHSYTSLKMPMNRLQVLDVDRLQWANRSAPQCADGFGVL